MTANLGTALQITLVGMGLVFGAILLLWILMACLVRLTVVRRAPTAAEQTTPEPAEGSEQLPARAAAAAVAAALAAQEPPRANFPLPPTALVSAWQAVRRSAQLNRRGPVR